MDLEKLKEQMTLHEGREKDLYQCSAGKWSIGIGHNLEDNGVSDAVIDLMFKEDIQESIVDLVETLFPGQFEQLPENVQHVLIDMRFQLGFNRFRKFKNMIAAVQIEDWQKMAREMKDSAWYGQVPTRADNLINMIVEVM